MVTRPYNVSIYIPFKITCTEQNCKVYRKTWQINPLVYILASGNLMGMVYEMSFLSRKLNTATRNPGSFRRTAMPPSYLCSNVQHFPLR